MCRRGRNRDRQFQRLDGPFFEYPDLIIAKKFFSIFFPSFFFSFPGIMGERRSRNGSGAGRGQAHAEGSYLAPIARIVPARGGGHGGVGCRHSCLGAATSGAHYSRKAFPRCFLNGMLLSGNNRIAIFPGPVRLSHFRRRPEPLANSASFFANPCAPAPQERLRTLSANGTALAHYSRKAKKQ